MPGFKSEVWIEVRVVVPPAAQEAISSFFFDQGSLGLTEEEGSDPQRGVYVLLRAYFERASFQREAFENGLREALAQADAGKPRIWIEELPYGDWAEGWKQYFKPRRVGRRLVIAPTWEEYAPVAGDLVVRVDPGMAFGTGQHETTSLCLKAIEDLAAEFAGKAVLDVGTGSGILAIAAVMLGAKSGLGIDNDPEAVSAARENVEANGLLTAVTIEETPLARVPGEFPLVVANILAEALIAMAPDLAPRVAAGGRLILSGILGHLAPKVCEAYVARGFEEVETRRDGEWACLIAKQATGSRSGAH